MNNTKTFTKKVREVVAKIPKGQVLSYKQVAKLADNPLAARAVGNIMNKNRNPNVPCHRVIRSDGQIGGFAFGAGKKTAILTTEGYIRGPTIRHQMPTSNVVLRSSFFNRPATKVAKELLGKFLVRRLGDKTLGLPITEVEAYTGPHDRACHASKGKTARTAAMFDDAGYFYIYFCYGVHWMLNIVTGPKNYPAAVLIRGAGPANGPGKLTKILKIDKALNGKKAIPKNGLWFEDRGVKINSRSIKKSPRIGVDYAGPIWAKKPYRFVLTRPNAYAQKL